MKPFNVLLFGCLTFAFFIAAPGCKKYEDGPLISFKSKQSRIVGYWDGVEHFIDGEAQEYGGGIFYDIDEDGGYHRVFEFGLWQFSDDKERLIMSPIFDNFFPYELVILRLTDSELWVETTHLENVHEYHLEKIERP